MVEHREPVKGKDGKPDDSPKSASATVSELGTNCWSAKRFVFGGRCEHVFTCNYPEKKTCQAVRTEITYMSRRLEAYVVKMKEKLQLLDDSIK